MATLLPVTWAGCLLQQPPPPPRRLAAEGRGAPAACQLRPGVSCAGGAVSGFTCRREQRLHACTAQPLLRRACGRGRWALRSSTDSVTPSDGGTRAAEATVSPATTSDKAALTTRVASARACPLPLVMGLSQGLFTVSRPSAQSAQATRNCSPHTPALHHAPLCIQLALTHTPANLLSPTTCGSLGRRNRRVCSLHRRFALLRLPLVHRIHRLRRVLRHAAPGRTR